MKRRNLALNALALVAAGYALAGCLPRLLRQSEFFPFAPWDLYSHVPNDFADYGLRVTSLDGAPLAAPVYFEAAPDWFAQAQSILAVESIQALGRAVEGGDAAEIARARGIVERDYLAGHPRLRYEVVKRSWEPLERWRSGRFASEAVLAAFEAGR
jgi:hypothetical protein